MTLFGFVLFIHVICVATWFGGVSLMSMVLRGATRTNNAESMQQTVSQVQRWNTTMFIPTAVLVLLSGVYMLYDLVYKTGMKAPLYLSIKERLGSLFIVAFILLITLLGSRIVKAVKAAGTDLAKAQALIKRYIMVLNISLLIMAVLIFFITTKIQ